MRNKHGELLIDVKSQMSQASNKILIDDKAPSYYHPGKSGSIYLNKDEEKPVAFFQIYILAF